MSLVFWSGILFLAYLLGSFPSGYLIVRLLTQDDVRHIGSGSTGATNVTRKAGVKAGLLTYVLDVGKGMLAVYVAGQLSGHNVHVMGSAGAIAILGHMFPIFLKFQGGKVDPLEDAQRIVILPKASWPDGSVARATFGNFLA